MNDRFWHDRRVLITGHNGFKGSWLTHWLKSKGASVAGFSLPYDGRNAVFPAAGLSSVDCVEGDITDAEAVFLALKRFQPSVVIHMAAQPLVRKSYKDPMGTYAVNVMGTINVLEACRKVSSVQAVVNVTTDKCYANREWIWGYREIEPMGGFDPYSNSKACSELVTECYQRSFFNQVKGPRLASARAGNVIGGGDRSEDRLMTDLIASFAKGQTAVLRHPYSVRPWQHVLEPLSGYLRLAEDLILNGESAVGAWNFGPYDQDAKPVGYVATELATLWGGDASWKHEQNVDGFHESTLLKLDVSKATTELGWEPKWRLNEALKQVVRWEKALLSGADICAVMDQQIDDYITSRGLDG
jgi:CDP-glucose 4,6-dehydratase